jgi:hypothetical protein
MLMCYVVIFLISDTAKYIQELKKLLQTPTEITVVLSFLIFPKGVPQLLYDGATKTTVCFLSLSKTNCCPFIFGSIKIVYINIFFLSMIILSIYCEEKSR